MPAIGPVYQPTTYNVGYEPQSEWPQQTRRSRVSKFLDWVQSDECCGKIFLGSVAVVAFVVTIILVESVTRLITGHYIIFGSESAVISVLVYALFVTFILAGCILLFMMYLRFLRNKRFYFWPFMRKEGLSRQMSGQGRNGQAMILNPSTDLLVTPAQYGPVTEAPPTMHEEDETKNLMSNDSKEINEETEERPNDLDPRIVLRPPGHRDDA